MAPAQGQWVISALHPDPTPFLGAPEAEYIALYASGEEGDCLTTEGLRLSWNGSERVLPGGCWPVGEVVLVHRSGDSLAFGSYDVSKISLASWPALVNGGTTVHLKDSLGQVLDIMPYTEGGLNGGGIPILRGDIEACGAEVNQVMWSADQGPFGPSSAASSSASAHTTEALLSAAGHFDRFIPRGLGMWEWQLGHSVDPSSAESAQMRVEGQVVDLEWLTDSSLLARWPNRMVQSLSSGQHLDRGLSVLLGPVRGCAAGSEDSWLKHTLHHLPKRGQIETLEVLADPHSNALFQEEEQVKLTNLSPFPIDAGAWSWGGAQLRRRRLLWPHSPAQFLASDFNDWPGLSNSGGEMVIRSPSGQEVASLSWSPCDHDNKALAGSGLPLERLPERNSMWSSAGGPSEVVAPNLAAFGCRKNGLGTVTGIDIHLNIPSAFLAPSEWRFQPPEGTSISVVPTKIGGQPLSWRLPVEHAQADFFLWPQGTVVSIQTEGGFWQPLGKFSCPPLVEPDALCLRMEEVLWDAVDSGGEFVELLNCGEVPLELGGLSATTKAWPLPSEWQTWIDPAYSVVLLPDSVLAFGECTKWFTAGFPESGPALWRAEAWSALNDEAGDLAIRLPGRSMDADRVQWSPDFIGPWWWSPDGWSWQRQGQTDLGWSPSSSRGSPGRLERVTERLDACLGATGEPVTRDGHSQNAPGIQWQFPEVGHQIEVRMVGWPDGVLKRVQILRPDDRIGSWAWDGCDESGYPMPPQSLIWDVRWAGPSCRGRKAIRVSAPGYGK